MLASWKVASGAGSSRFSYISWTAPPLPRETIASVLSVTARDPESAPIPPLGKLSSRLFQNTLQSSVPFRQGTAQNYRQHLPVPVPFGLKTRGLFLHHAQFHVPILATVPKPRVTLAFCVLGVWDCQRTVLVHLRQKPSGQEQRLCGRNGPFRRAWSSSHGRESDFSSQQPLDAAGPVRTRSRGLWRILGGAQTSPAPLLPQTGFY